MEVENLTGTLHHLTTNRPDILGPMRFDPEYVSQVLNENFEDAKTLFLSPLIAIHYAHLVMLAEPRHRRGGSRARDS